MKNILAALVSAALLLSTMPSHAVLVPKSGSGDPRIYVVEYDPTQVVELRATMGYQTFIEFARDEHIENVAVGDASNWQITPNRAANLLFIKPLADGPVTNMTVVTNYRQYAFELRARPHAPAGDRRIMYSLRFQYPETAVARAEPKSAAEAPPPPPKIANAAYSYDGSGRIVPARIFDDGHATYFEFRDNDAYPAILAMDAEKHETVVNTYIRGGYVVADLVAPGFALREGNEVVHIYNDGFAAAVPGPQSPRQRTKSCSNWLCL